MGYGRIPIQPAAACSATPRAVPEPVQPALLGDRGRIDPLLKQLQDQVDQALGGELPMDTWLRAFHLADGEAQLQLAPGLACRGLTIASLAFDLLRARLPDTDVYVGESPQAPPQVMADLAVEGKG